MNVSVRKYKEIDFNKKEALRYAGCNNEDEVFSKYIEDAFNDFNGKEKFAVCYAYIPIKVEEDTVDFSYFKVKSKSLSSHLKKCETAVIFVATIGIEMDRLIKKYSSVSVSKAICFNALGTERIESLADKFCSEIKNEVFPKKTTFRFSPGYGDLPLETERDIFSLLNCPKNIGVTLTDSLLMIPVKSVSAIIGIGEKDCENKSGCDNCELIGCEFRGL